MNYKVPFIRPNYIRFYARHKKEIDKAISNCLSKGSLIMESEVEKFEKNFAKFCHKKYCISTSSGTDALKITSSLGKFNPLSSYRYRLPEDIMDSKSDIVLFTYMNSVFNIDKVPFKYHLIIEDACQAVGKPLLGDVSCFSFYPAKMLGGIGKGGAIVTDHKDLYLKLRKIRDDKWNNMWLDEVHAAFLNVKLKYLPDILKRRQKIANLYNKHFPREIIWSEYCLQNYIIIVKEHDKFIKFMRKKGIEVISDKSDFYEGNLKNAVRIPLYEELTDKEVNYVISQVKNYFK